MSTPFNPNQQPIPGNGQYPTGQQYTQQMPAAGGYQQQGYQQPQQGFYPQGQFPGAPYGGQPEAEVEDRADHRHHRGRRGRDPGRWRCDLGADQGRFL